MRFRETTSVRFRSRTLAASYPGQHVIGGAELNVAYLPGLDGEVEGDLELAAVDPGGTRTILDEDGEGSRGSAVEEAGHLIAALQACRRAERACGCVGGDHCVGSEQLQQPGEVTFTGRGHERVHD